MIAKRRLTFIGRVVRISEEKIPARVLSAWCNLKRPVGRPNISTRFSLLQDIGKIIPNVGKDVSFRSWGHVAKDELLWSMLINNIGSSKNSIIIMNGMTILVGIEGANSRLILWHHQLLI